MKNNITYIFLLLVVFGCTSNYAGQSERQPTEQPNILFIMADDLGNEWISCYGAEEIETPNIDQLASGGMRFTHAYSMPKCTPTRVTLLTGQYPWRSGWVNHWDVPRWGSGCHFDWQYYLTFARVLKAAGYTTAAAGKWQINDFRIQPDAMKKHGFDDYCMWTGFESGNPPSAERYWNPYLHTKEGSQTYEGQFSTDIMVDFLINFMQENKDKPMMMYLPLNLPHVPFTTTPLHTDATGEVEQQKAMVTYIDRAVGRLVKALEELNLRENTIIFFTTDNGSTSSLKAYRNGRIVKGGKGEVAEPGVNAPFIVNCPGLVPAGVTTPALIDFSDMMPTFAALGGAALPDSIAIDGHSFAELILGKTQATSRDWIMAMGGAVAEVSDQGRVVPAKAFAERVVREKQYKLWVDTTGKSKKLFDLVADSAEEKNLLNSTDPAHQKAQKKLEAIVQSFPESDAAPRYDPTPPQAWDKVPSWHQRLNNP